jgi:hypothetical protein
MKKEEEFILSLKKRVMKNKQKSLSISVREFPGFKFFEYGSCASLFVSKFLNPVFLKNCKKILNCKKCYFTTSLVGTSVLKIEM